MKFSSNLSFHSKPSPASNIGRLPVFCLITVNSFFLMNNLNCGGCHDDHRRVPEMCPHLCNHLKTLYSLIA